MMEENNQSELNQDQNSQETESNVVASESTTPSEKPVVKRARVNSVKETVIIPTEVNSIVNNSDIENQNSEATDRFVPLTEGTKKLNKKNLKKLKKMSEKIKEKAKQAKEKQKEKDKKAKKKKKEKAKKEKVRKKLKEKKAKKKANKNKKSKKK